ncbi:MAG: hypothetical protein AAB572_02135 [Patescibacteria group bacterium]
MEIVLVLILVANLAYGFRKNWIWYQKELDLQEEKLKGREMEIPWIKRNIWSFLMVIVPVFVILYENRTNFSQWEYASLVGKFKHSKKPKFI